MRGGSRMTEHERRLSICTVYHKLLSRKTPMIGVTISSSRRLAFSITERSQIILGAAVLLAALFAVFGANDDNTTSHAYQNVLSDVSRIHLA